MIHCRSGIEATPPFTGIDGYRGHTSFTTIDTQAMPPFINLISVTLQIAAKTNMEKKQRQDQAQLDFISFRFLYTPAPNMLRTHVPHTREGFISYT